MCIKLVNVGGVVTSDVAASVFDDSPLQMHLQSQNYVEAALTLKLHSDLHEWDLNSLVGPMDELGLPQQSHFHRKETLCLLILDYLGLYILIGTTTRIANAALSVVQVEARLGKTPSISARN